MTQQLNLIKVKMDLTRARLGGHVPKHAYEQKIHQMVCLKTKQELVIYLIDENPNVRLAAKLLIDEVKE